MAIDPAVPALGPGQWCKIKPVPFTAYLIDACRVRDTPDTHVVGPPDTVYGCVPFSHTTPGKLGRALRFGGAHGGYTGNDIHEWRMEDNTWRQSWKPDVFPEMNACDLPILGRRIPDEPTQVRMERQPSPHLIWVEHSYQTIAWHPVRQKWWLWTVYWGLLEYDPEKKELTPLISWFNGKVSTDYLQCNFGKQGLLGWDANILGGVMLFWVQMSVNAVDNVHAAGIAYYDEKTATLKWWDQTTAVPYTSSTGVFCALRPLGRWLLRTYNDANDTTGFYVYDARTKSSVQLHNVPWVKDVNGYRYQPLHFAYDEGARLVVMLGFTGKAPVRAAGGEPYQECLVVRGDPLADTWEADLRTDVPQECYYAPGGDHSAAANGLQYDQLTGCVIMYQNATGLGVAVYQGALWAYRVSKAPLKAGPKEPSAPPAVGPR